MSLGNVSSVSIVIPTYNRIHELIETLSSIENQTVLPKEIIIVDDNFESSLEPDLRSERHRLCEKGVKLRYIQNSTRVGLTKSRNIGVRKSSGEIILFLDDDVLLDKDYLKHLLHFYSVHREVLGVQGYWECNNKKSRISFISNILLGLFYLPHYEYDSCNVLPSMNNTYPLNLSYATPCQWLSGCNQSYRKTIFDEFQFDEKLIKYSWKEDLDFSYSIWKKYPNTLYIIPEARLIHKQSEVARMPNERSAYMKEAYSRYLFHKHFSKGTKNKLIYEWSKIGELLFILITSFTQRDQVKDAIVKVKYWSEARKFIRLHEDEVKKGDLEFTKKYL